MPAQECVDTHSGFRRHSTPHMPLHTLLCSLTQVCRQVFHIQRMQGVFSMAAWHSTAWLGPRSFNHFSRMDIYSCLLLQTVV